MGFNSHSDMSDKDYYSILGVDRNASQEAIKRAFMKLAVLYHPDKNHGHQAAEKFKEINEAYAILSDKEKRQQYDCRNHTDFDQRYVYDHAFGGRCNGFEKPSSGGFFCHGRGRGMGRGRRRNKFFQDSFSIFGREWFDRPEDTVYDLPLTASEAIWGTEKEILIRTRWESQKLTVKIPPGLKDGALLQMQGTPFGTSEKNLYLRVRVRN